MKNVGWAYVGLGLFLLLCLTMGLIILLLFTPLWIDAVGLGQDMVKTTGTIVGINTWTESGDTYHSPDVRYTTEDGRQFTLDMWCPPFGCFPDSTIGSEVAVIYPKNDPERAMADTLMGRAVSPTFMMFIGLGFTLIGTVGLWAAVSGAVSLVNAPRQGKTRKDKRIPAPARNRRHVRRPR